MIALVITCINLVALYLISTAYKTRKEQRTRGYDESTENVNGLYVFGYLLLFISWYIINVL